MQQKVEILEGQVQEGEERGAGEVQEWSRGGSHEEMEVPPYTGVPRAL